MDDRKILDHSPLPIARGYRRYLNSLEVRERHDASYYLFEIYLKYISSIAIAHYLSGTERDHRINSALKGLTRPSLGEWVRFLRECLRFLAQKEGATPALQNLMALYERKDGNLQLTLDLYNGMRSLRLVESGACREVSIEMLLGELVAYRNRVLGHGAQLQIEHYSKFAELFSGSFVEVFRNSPFLNVRRLISFDSIQVEENSLIKCRAIEYMGLHPILRAQPYILNYGDPLPVKQSLYLLDEDGKLLLMDPLLIAHKEDVYFLNEAEGVPEYLSYSTGERYRPSSFLGTQGELFRRILGYKVDETRISRMGDDVATRKEVPSPKDGASQETGQRCLGDYRIVREIGRGAMGVIFEAVQESLGRRVALKVLPCNFAMDRQWVERFYREARATARIHHPNIVPVYEVGEAEGSHYYAMEFIDGPSLGQILLKARGESSASGGGQGNLIARDPNYIARNVERIADLAEGLHEAHRLGLIHRDVKPTNIMVDSGGNFVLVDFGLVRDINKPGRTGVGVMVGTPNYSSPEQVSSGQVDPRSDLYSLGATLYEILTLRVPFSGKNDTELRNAILFEDPVAPRKINPRVNRDLEALVLRALEKNPARRYQDCAEMAADLRRFLRYEPIKARHSFLVTRLSRKAWRYKGRTGAALLILALILLAIIQARRPSIRYNLTSLRMTSGLELSTEPALSPDGKLVAYAADSSGEGNLDLWIQQVMGVQPRRLTFNPADDREPAFSPTGSELAFRSERNGGGIYIISLANGEERKLASQGRHPLFSPDGKRILYWVGDLGGAYDGRIFTIDPSGGEPCRLASDMHSARYPVWSRDGKSVLFVGCRKDRIWDWWIAPLEGGVAKRTGAFDAFRKKQIYGDPNLQDIFPGHWSVEDGLAIFSALKDKDKDASLWQVPISHQTGNVSGPIQQLKTSMDGGTGTNRIYPSNRVGGLFVYAKNTLTINICSLPIERLGGDPGGELKYLTMNQAQNVHPFATPDGKFIVFSSYRLGSYDIYIKNLQDGEERILVGSPLNEVRPVISPDGKKVAFEVHAGSRDLHVLTMDGSKQEMIFLGHRYPYQWTGDGMHLLHSSVIERRGVSLLDISTKQSLLILHHPSYDVWNGRFAPDEKWITFNAGPNDQHRSQVFVAPYGGRTVAENEWIAVSDGESWDDKPNWDPSGSTIYFFSERDGFRCLWAQRLAPQKMQALGEPTAVKHFHSVRSSPGNVGLFFLDLSIARDSIILNLGDLAGSVWVAALMEERGED